MWSLQEFSVRNLRWLLDCFERVTRLLFAKSLCLRRKTHVFGARLSPPATSRTFGARLCQCLSRRIESGQRLRYLSKWSPRMYFRLSSWLKGCGMGPWLVLVSPCFRENEVATCKIGSFLCSLDNLLQKNVIVFFFGNQISKWRSFEKRAIFDLLFTFFIYQGNLKSTDLTHIHTRILLTLLTFFALPILKKIRIYQARFLFGMIPGVDSYSRHFGTINK